MTETTRSQETRKLLSTTMRKKREKNKILLKFLKPWAIIFVYLVDSYKYLQAISFRINILMSHVTYTATSIITKLSILLRQ